MLYSEGKDRAKVRGRRANTLPVGRRKTPERATLGEQDR